MYSATSSFASTEEGSNPRPLLFPKIRSFNATRALFNPSITEVKNLIQSAKDEKSPIMVALSQPITSRLSQHSNGASLHNRPKSLSLKFGTSNCMQLWRVLIFESVTPLVTTLDQSTISDISQHVTPAPIKGKRRITNKRKGDKDDLTTTSHVFSAGPTEERVTKVIKQEK
ncbi:hypothetical protein K1719_013710 [Acacia pycnantha]|nr:hypothetical protein K1719_013710 [Acacia pycnantha]